MNCTNCGEPVQDNWKVCPNCTSPLASSIPEIEMIDCINFKIGKYPVTFAQYDAYCEATGKEKPYDEGWGRENRPVINVNWHDAKAFCEWLSTQTGKRFRLPYESEWEFAAKGGNYSRGYEYAGSNNLDEVSWNSDNSKNKTQPVGLKKPNELGIYDMSGNVWEWCEDWYDEIPVEKVLRGGSWINIDDENSISFYANDLPDDSDYCNGFRLAQDP